MQVAPEHPTVEMLRDLVISVDFNYYDVRTLLQGDHFQDQCDQDSWGTDPERIKFQMLVFVLSDTL